MNIHHSAAVQPGLSCRYMACCQTTPKIHTCAVTRQRLDRRQPPNATELALSTEPSSKYSTWLSLQTLALRLSCWTARGHSSATLLLSQQSRSDHRITKKCGRGMPVKQRCWKMHTIECACRSTSTTTSTTPKKYIAWIPCYVVASCDDGSLSS